MSTGNRWITWEMEIEAEKESRASQNIRICLLEASAFEEGRSQRNGYLLNQ